MKTITVAVEVELTEKQMVAIVKGVGGEASPTKKVQTVAESAVRDMADGGIMLPADAVDRIEAAINSIKAERIVESVEASANRQGQQIVLHLAIDPGWYPTLKEASESQGRPVEDLMQECMGHAFQQGWLYALPSEPPPLLVSREDHDFLKKTLGLKQVFGSDVVNWLRELVAAPEENNHASV